MMASSKCIWVYVINLQKVLNGSPASMMVAKGVLEAAFARSGITLYQWLANLPGIYSLWICALS